MFKFDIKYQEEYSRGEAVLRALFGWIYILVPHGLVMYFLAVASSIISFITWWAILFTGRFPKSFFDYQLGYYRWSARVNAVFLGLADGYPAFSLSPSENDQIIFELEYNEEYSRGQLLLLSLFGWAYVLIPHGIVLIFLAIFSSFLSWLGFWAVLFTGKFPKSFHDFITGTYRWYYRVLLHFGFMYKSYPAFSMQPDDQLETK